MKFNVEIDISYLYGDGTLDEAFEGRLVNELVNKVSNDTKSKIQELATKKIEDVFTQKLNDIFEEFVNKGFTIYDKWGDIEKEKVNVKELLKEKLDNFMSEKLDNYGKASSYGTARYAILIKNEHERQINDFLEKLSSTIISQIKEDINKQAIDRISKAILSDYNLKKLIK